MAVIESPGAFLQAGDWAAVGAICVAAGGDGCAFVGRSVHEEGALEERATAAAMDLPLRSARWAV
eukprot:9953988-Lingulodinium_polyedra.AAC.1